MGFAADQLRDKALLALEEVVQECRYRQPRCRLSVRFALAYLWSLKPTDRAPYDDFWRGIRTRETLWRHGVADTALSGIYKHLGVVRHDELSMLLWKRRFAEEREAE